MEGPGLEGPGAKGVERRPHQKATDTVSAHSTRSARAAMAAPLPGLGLHLNASNF